MKKPKQKILDKIKEWAMNGVSDWEIVDRLREQFAFETDEDEVNLIVDKYLR